MSRLPNPGGDAGEWGAILNDYLQTIHDADGMLKSGVVTEDNLENAVKDKLNATASGGATNLSSSTTATTVIVASDTGSDATLGAASTSSAGVLTAADKTKLDGIAAGAQVNTVASVAGKTGAVTLVKTDVGLSNVDNTSDTNKPISTATQSALNAKANTSHAHTVSDITASGTASSTTYLRGDGTWNTPTTSSATSWGDITGTLSNQTDLSTALNSKAATSHTHSLDNLSDVAVTSPSVGQVIKYNGSSWVNDTDATSGGSGSTNLSVTTDATTVTIASDTGTDAVIPSVTTSQAGTLSAADKVKLNGIATGATLNSSDAQLRDRSTHTGTQTASTISDFAETVRDTVASSLVAGSNVTITPDDNANTITIASTGSGGGGSTTVTVNSQTGTSYTPVIGDAGLIIETTNSSAVTLTVPPNNIVPFAVGTTIGLRQYGTGQLTIAADTGVVIRSRGSVYRLGGQYGEAVLTKRATNEWILSGDLVA